MLITYEMALQQLKEDSADKKILELLSAIKGFQIESLTSLSARQLLVVADRLAITEASVRMALSRQAKHGKLIRANGSYALTSNNHLFALPRFWLDMQERCDAWHHDWFLINLGQQKFKPTIMRRLTRKAELLGLKMIPSLGWVRPNNLTNLHSEVAYHFELVTGSCDFLISNMVELTDVWQKEFTKQWNISELNHGYQHNLSFIRDEQSALDKLNDREILIRSFAIGRLIVEYLANDPWLPNDMVDHQSRNLLVEEAVKYYQKIMPAWLRVLN